MTTPNQIGRANSRPASSFESRRLRWHALIVKSHGRCHGGAAVPQFFRSARLMNANGVLSSSPGLRRKALPWVMRSILSSTPSGLHHGRQIGADGTPLGFGAIWGRLPRVGAPSSRQPWAEGWNAFGVRGVWCFSSVPMPAAEQACCRQRRDCAAVSNQTLLVRRAEHERSDQGMKNDSRTK